MANNINTGNRDDAEVEGGQMGANIARDFSMEQPYQGIPQVVEEKRLTIEEILRRV